MFGQLCDQCFASLVNQSNSFQLTSTSLDGTLSIESMHVFVWLQWLWKGCGGWGVLKVYNTRVHESL